MKKSSSMFLSNAKRLAYVDTNVKGPPVGEYNPKTLNSIEEITSKKIPRPVNKPLNMTRDPPLAEKCGFGSSMKTRFDDALIDECQAFMGPGYYDHDTFVNNKKSKGKSEEFDLQVLKFNNSYRKEDLNQ